LPDKIQQTVRNEIIRTEKLVRKTALPSPSEHSAVFRLSSHGFRYIFWGP